MASTALTLAALATSAVPGMLVYSSQHHREDSDGEFMSAVITGDISVSDARSELTGSTDGDERSSQHETGPVRCIVRVPKSSTAEVRQSAELLSLAALTEGTRARLPFEVPKTLGLTRAGDTRAVVSTFVSGEHFSVEDLCEDALLLAPIAEAIAAIHHLPHSIAHNGGLPVRSSVEAHKEVLRLVDRAAATRLLPEAVHRRWADVLAEQDLWDFAPTVIHGSLDAAHLVVFEDRIVGVLGWSELSVGDPAVDLAWLIASGRDVFEAVLARYVNERDVIAMGGLSIRAKLYHELSVARWLLHGTDTFDQSVIDDAVAMLDLLVSRPGLLRETSHVRAPLGEAEVAELLDQTPVVSDQLSDTAAGEALDEDRMFGDESDFLEVDDVSGGGGDMAGGGGGDPENI